MYSMRKTWTDKERQILKDYYGKISLVDLQAKLPNRNPNQIYKQVSYLRKRGWTFGTLLI